MFSSYWTLVLGTCLKIQGRAQRCPVSVVVELASTMCPYNHVSHVVAVIGRPYSGLTNDVGIYFSTDEGNSWHLSNAPANLSPSAYLFSIQAGTASEGHFYAFYEFAGWFETRDMGAHWHLITNSPLSNMETPSLLTDPTNPDHLLLGGDLGLFETYNDGRSWSQVTVVSGNVLNIVASQTAPTVPRRIFCTTDQGIYRWQADSTSITHIAHLPMTNPPQRLVTDARGSTLYALSGQGLWSSTDGGTTWQHRWQFDRDDLISFLVDPLNPQHLYAGFFLPGKVIVSNDGGASWQTITQ